MSIFMNEKIQAGLISINAKTESLDGVSVAGATGVSSKDLFEKIDLELNRISNGIKNLHHVNNQDHLSVYAGTLTPKIYNPGKNGATADEVRNKLFAETAMAAVKEKMAKENISPEMLPQEMIEQIIADNIVESEIDKLVSELPPEVQTPMAEAFRAANKNHNRDRNRNRGRGHRE